MNIKKAFYVLFYLSSLFMAVNITAGADKICTSSTVLKNPSGDNSFGAIWNYPGDIEPSVWFPIVPRAIAIDSKGNIYVGDSVKYRVMKFNEKGEFLLQFKLQPPQTTPKPEISHIIRDIGLDKSDNVYVWNYLEGRVEIYEQDGKYKESVPPNDDKQRGVFTKTSKGKFARYIYEIDSYSKKTGGLFYSITVFDVSGKAKKIVSRCGGINMAYDEAGTIFSFDYNGNIYTFDSYLNVIKIDPFK